MKVRIAVAAGLLAAAVCSVPALAAPDGCGPLDAGVWIGRSQAQKLVEADQAASKSTRPIMLPVMDYDPMSIALWFDRGAPARCFDPASPPSPEVQAEIERAVYQSLLRYFQQGSRWGTTANTPQALTWSFIPDGTNIPSGFSGDPAGPSVLFAQMDAKFGGAGNRAVWIAQFQACFDRWAALTGTSYTRVTFNGNPWDDGAVFSSSSGTAGVRGDVRIGGRNIDGGSNVLAYNFFPQFGGDMVLDTSENWANSAGSYIFLRNTLYHEHGHGLGMLHVCPTNGSKLMEPFLNTGFDGPQHDDLLGVMNLYGDAFESNDSSGTATNLGALAPGGSLNPTNEPAPAISNGSLASIGVNGDVDFYLVSLSAAVPVSVTVTPRGLTYDSSPQCGSGNNVNSLTYAPLSVEIRGSNGTTVLGSNGAAAGSSAQISNVNVPAGNFYVRVFETGAPTRPQLYDLSIAAGAIPAPANNACASASAIGFGTVTGTNVGATADGGNNCNAGSYPDVWYQITPNCSGTLVLDTCGSAFDTVISVHSACVGTAANQLACNDDNQGAGPCAGEIRASYLTVPVTAGTNYKIRVAGFNGLTGLFTLNVSFQGATNDACASPAALAPGNGYTGFTCGASNDGSSSCGPTASSPDVWYTYTPSCNHQLVLDTCGSNFDTVLTVYTGACGSQTEVACNDDNAGAGPCSGQIRASYLSIPVIAGTPYAIRVSGFAGAVGNYVLNAGPVQQTNDLCVNAAVITSGDYVGATCGAAREVNDSCRPTSPSGDVWYQWVAPCTGNLVIDTCGSGYDTVISVHTGACGSLAQADCNDDAGGAGRCSATLNSFISTPVTSGTAYYIRVSGYSGQTGIFNLRITQQPNDNCADAANIALGITNYDTTCATVDGNATCGTSAASPDVWYRHVATCTSPIWVDTCGSGYDNVISAYTGACGGLTEVACNDDQFGRCPSSGANSFIAFRALVGIEYALRVSGYAGASGTGVINIRCCPPDFNLSGVVSVQDIFDFLAGYFANDPNADINNSGTVSVQDIFDFLAAYFAGCA